MLLTQHYDQRPFDKTVCDAIIANGGVKKRQKRCKTFAMEDASNTVQILVACAIQGIRFSSINRFRWGGTKQTGSQMKVCAMYSIRFTRMNYLWLGYTKEMVSQMKMCAMYGMRFTWMNCLRWDKRTETVQYNKMCVIRGKQVCNQKCVRRSIITQTIAANKQCVLWANAWWYTIVSGWWNHHRRVPQYGPCAMSLHTEQHHMYL